MKPGIVHLNRKAVGFTETDQGVELRFAELKGQVWELLKSGAHAAAGVGVDRS